MGKLQTIRRFCWWGLAVWALVFMTPLFMILRELAGAGRGVFLWGMGTAPFVLLGGGVSLGLLEKSDRERRIRVGDDEASNDVRTSKSVRKHCE